jgi:hypothetical protein
MKLSLLFTRVVVAVSSFDLSVIGMGIDEDLIHWFPIWLSKVAKF